MAHIWVYKSLAANELTAITSGGVRFSGEVAVASPTFHFAVIAGFIPVIQGRMRKRRFPGLPEHVRQ